MYWSRSFSSVARQRSGDKSSYIPSQTWSLPLKAMGRRGRISTKRVACSDLYFVKIDLEVGVEEERGSQGAEESKSGPIRKP